MKRTPATLLLCLIFYYAVQCEAQPPGDSLFSTFNTDAERYIGSLKGTLDFEPLTDVNKCILEKYIKGDLDELNNLSLSIVGDRFIHRNYFVEELNIDFNILWDFGAKEYYLLVLPSLVEFTFNAPELYKKDDGSMLILKDSARLLKVASPFFDVFLIKSTYRGTSITGRWKR